MSVMKSICVINFLRRTSDWEGGPGFFRQESKEKDTWSFLLGRMRCSFNDQRIQESGHWRQDRRRHHKIQWFEWEGLWRHHLSMYWSHYEIRKRLHLVWLKTAKWPNAWKGIASYVAMDCLHSCKIFTKNRSLVVEVEEEFCKQPTGECGDTSWRVADRT